MPMSRNTRNIFQIIESPFRFANTDARLFISFIFRSSKTHPPYPAWFRLDRALISRMIPRITPIIRKYTQLIAADAGAPKEPATVM